MGRPELLLFGGLVLAAFAVYLFVSALMSQKTDQQALSWASGDEPVKSKSPIINFSRPLLHQFTLKYALKIKNQSYRKRIQKILLTAGMSRELNVDEFIGLQILWGVMFPLLLVVLNFALQLGLSTVVIVLLGGLGLYFPEMHCRALKKQRESSVRSDLPFFADLLALSTEAGLDFVGSIQRIVEKAEGSVLGEELSIVLKDIKLGAARADAMKALATRLDMNEITSFVSVLVDADATGAPISKVLKDQSEQMRLERFVRAEKAGAQASQVIMIPLVLFILPAVFIMVFGPVVIQFMGNK